MIFNEQFLTVILFVFDMFLCDMISNSFFSLPFLIVNICSISVFSTNIATTQPTTQNNFKQFCWGGIIIG